MSVPRWRPALKMLRTKMSRHAAENLNTQKRKTQKAKRIGKGTFTTTPKTVNPTYAAILRGCRKKRARDNPERKYGI